MFINFLAAAAAAAAAASASAPATKPDAPIAPTKPASAQQITAQTPLTVTFTAGFLEGIKAAVHAKYPGDEADPVIKVITDQENEAVSKVQSAPKK